MAGKYAELAAYMDAPSNSLLHDASKVNVCVCTLRAGRGLLAMDRNITTKNSSDPQVLLRCGGETKKSTCKKQTLVPTWDEDFRFALLDGAEGETLELEMEDWDLLSSNDFMGKVRIDLRQLEKESREWSGRRADTSRIAAPPRPRRGESAEAGARRGRGREESVGDLFGGDGSAQVQAPGPGLQVRQRPRRSGSGDPIGMGRPLRLFPRAVRARRRGAEFIKDRRDPGAEPAPHGHHAGDGLQGQHELGPEVRLERRRADVRDGNHLQDAHAAVARALRGAGRGRGPIFRRAGRGRRRRVVKRLHGPRPRAPAERRDGRAPPLQDGGASVCRKHGSKTELRVSQVPLDDLLDKKRKRTWITLLDKSERADKDRGEIELAFRWVHDPRLERFAEADDVNPGEANELCVAIVQARGLLAMDSGKMFGGAATTADPLCKIRLAGDQKYKHRTKSAPKTLRPWWNVEFRLPLSSNDATLELVVEDHDSFGSNDFMGKCAVDLRGLERGPILRSWHALDDEKDAPDAERGSLDVVLRYVRTCAATKPPGRRRLELFRQDATNRRVGFASSVTGRFRNTYH